MALATAFTRLSRRATRPVDSGKHDPRNTRTRHDFSPFRVISWIVLVRAGQTRNFKSGICRATQTVVSLSLKTEIPHVSGQMFLRRAK